MKLPLSNPVPVLLAGLIQRQASHNPVPGVSTTVRLPPSQPGYAEYLDPHLASLSIELDNFPVWTGEAIGEVNNYTAQLLENLGERTGQGVWIRVGGTSELPRDNSEA